MMKTIEEWDIPAAVLERWVTNEYTLDMFKNDLLKILKSE